MPNIAVFKRESTRQAAAVLAVDNIFLPSFAIDIAHRIESGSITQKQAREEVIEIAKKMASTSRPKAKINP